MKPGKENDIKGPRIDSGRIPDYITALEIHESDFKIQNVNMDLKYKLLK